jgi:hypothetical protein
MMSLEMIKRANRARKKRGARDRRVLSKGPKRQRSVVRKPSTRYQCSWCRTVVTLLKEYPPTLLTVQRPRCLPRTFKICPDCVEFWLDDNGFSLLTRRR